MAVAPFLLYSKEIGESVVERALYVASVGPPIGKVGGHGPSLGVESRRVGVHAPCTVVAVGSAQREAMACWHAARTEVIIVAAGHAVHRKAVALEGQGEVNVAGLLIQPANHGIPKLSRLHVVHWRTVDVHVIVLLIQSAVTKANGGE